MSAIVPQVSIVPWTLQKEPRIHEHCLSYERIRGLLTVSCPWRLIGRYLPNERIDIAVHR